MPLSLEDVIDMVNVRMQSDNGTEKSLMFEIHKLLLELEEKRNENKKVDSRVERFKTQF
jgi:hypothetical protein